MPNWGLTPSGLLYRSSVPVSVAGPVVETDILIVAVPARTLMSQRGVQLFVAVDSVDPSVGANPVCKLYFGTTLIGTFLTSTYGAGVVNRVAINYFLYAYSDSQQFYTLEYANSQPTPYALISEDPTISNNLRLTVTQIATTTSRLLHTSLNIV